MKTGYLYMSVILRALLWILLVLVITCLEGYFGINCPSAVLKMLKLPELGDLSQKHETCDYWLITRNLQTLCIKTNIFQQWKITISELEITK